MPKPQSKTMIVGPKDSALIIREDGSTEAYIPDQPELEAAYPSTARIAMLMFVLHDVATLEIVQRRWDAVFEKKKKEEPPLQN